MTRQVIDLVPVAAHTEASSTTDPKESAMKTIVPSRLLRTALVIDAIGSALMAALHLAFGPALATQTGLGAALIFETGAFMVLYVALLVVLARASRLSAAWATAVVAGNLGWAAAAIGLMALLAPTGPGIALLAAHAVATLAFAGLQFAGLRASWPTGGAALAA